MNDVPSNGEGCLSDNVPSVRLDGFGKRAREHPDRLRIAWRSQERLTGYFGIWVSDGSPR